MHGKGHFIWPDGKFYKGDYIDDKKHGYGKTYEGGFVSGKQHGNGIIITAKGKKLVGVWEKGKLVSVQN